MNTQKFRAILGFCLIACIGIIVVAYFTYFSHLQEQLWSIALLVLMFVLMAATMPQFDAMKDTLLLHSKLTNTVVIVTLMLMTCILGTIVSFWWILLWPVSGFVLRVGQEIYHWRNGDPGYDCTKGELVLLITVGSLYCAFIGPFVVCFFEYPSQGTAGRAA